MFDVGLPVVTTSLTFTTNFRVVHRLIIIVILWGMRSITIWEAGGIRNTISLAVGVIFWAAPVIAVEIFSFSGSIVVITCWVIVSIVATMKVMLRAAVTFSNTFS